MVREKVSENAEILAGNSTLGCEVPAREKSIHETILEKSVKFRRETVLVNIYQVLYLGQS
jgi:hypothetical protein